MAVVAWFLYQPLLHNSCSDRCATRTKGADLKTTLVTLDPLEPFAIRIKISAYVGVCSPCR